MAATPSRRALTWWFGLMALGGLAFGLNAERRPFGDDILAHPLMIFFLFVGVGLLALRVLLRRPVPELLPERTLVAGCFVGVAAFLAGNWAAAVFGG
jgi:type IV secretory pathway TrbL component